MIAGKSSKRLCCDDNPTPSESPSPRHAQEGWRREDNSQTPRLNYIPSTSPCFSDMSPNRSKLLQRHLLSPGHEGYRTPTIEDGEGHHIFLPQFAASRESVHQGGSILHRHSRATPQTPPILENEKVNGDGTSWPTKLPWKARLRHFTWAYFTLTMATGGVANVLHQVPLRFHGLEPIGLIFFFATIVFYIIIWTMISFRFYYYPSTFKDSFTHPTESLFVPASVVSFGTILINISQYGLGHTGPWLNNAVCILFWIDAALAIIFSCGIYLLLWSTQTFTIAKMTPIWIFPAYPLLIVGPHAGILSATLSQRRAFDIIVGGTTIQGIGFLVSLMVYSAFIYRLMTQKLPRESLRPGMFVSVGPSGFTAAAIITMADSLKKAVPADLMDNGPLAAFIIKVVADWGALWIWGLALWFFFISVFAHWSCVGHGKLQFSMTWYSFVFPNTALVTATFAVGRAFGSQAIKIVGCVMTCLLLITYFFVFTMMIRALILHQILWPEMGEDKSEGGWKSDLRPPQSLSISTAQDV